MRVTPPNDVSARKISNAENVANICKVIDHLSLLPHSLHLAMSKLGLSSNSRDWIRQLLLDSPPHDGSLVKFLLRDFTDSMKTRMREETKYVLAVVGHGFVFLCHSVFGEQTLTPEWKTIPRMLDTGNVLRYVRFAVLKGEMKAHLWERNATSSFSEWLGLPRKEAFLYGGQYRILFSLDGITTEMQLCEEELAAWVSNHSEIRKGKIELSESVKLLKVDEIRVGNKRYEAAADFIQDFEAEQHGIPRYQREYRRLCENQAPLLLKHYDEQTQVVRIEGENESVVVVKEHPGFDILFANALIEIRASYLESIVSRLGNGQITRLCHAGCSFSAEPFRYKNLEIHNSIIIPDSVQEIVNHVDQIGLLDSSLDLILKICVLEIIADANNNSPIAIILNRIAVELCNSLPLTGKILDDEGKLIEFKSRDFLAKTPEKELIQALADDIRRKTKTSKCKSYIFGVEDDGHLEPVSERRMRSERLSRIQAALLAELKLPYLRVVGIRNNGSGLVIIVAHT